MKTRPPASRLKLTISLLVSNRIDTIRKCLDSIQPLLQQLPSELIVVDTVGEENSDGSLAIAREYTNHIVRFPWCNDFAAARNAGLKQARGEWFLYLDDDEWFEDVTPILDFLKNDDGTYQSCVYDVRNYENHAGSAYKDSVAGRMARRNANTIFKNKIHEFLVQFAPVKQLDCFVHHYGYVYTTRAEHIKHSKRNIAPLLEMLEKDPRDIRNIMQLAQEYYSIQEYQKVRELCERALKFGLKNTTGYMSQLVIYYISILSKSNEIEAMVNAAQTYIDHPHVTELGKAMICLMLQSESSPLITEERFLAYADAYFLNVDILDQNPGMLPSQLVLAQKQCISDHHRKYMLRRVMQLCNTLGNWEKARDYLRRYCLTGKNAEAYLSVCMAPAVDTALAAGELQTLCEELRPALHNAKLLYGFLCICESALGKLKDETNKWDGIRVLSLLPLNHPRISVQKMLLSERENRAQELPALLLEYAAQENESIPAHDLIALCYRNHVDLKPLTDKLYIETWETTCTLLLKEFPAPEREALVAYLQQFWDADSPEMLFLKANVLFDALQALIKGTPEMAEFDAAFAHYVETNAAYYRLLSPPGAFSPERCGYLGKDAKAAFFLTQAQKYKKEDRPELQVRSIRKALTFRENLSELARYMADAIKEQQANAPLSPAEEMRRLSASIKSSVSAFLRAQEWAQAKELLDSLKAITPDDPELKSLYAKLPDGR